MNNVNRDIFAPDFFSPISFSLSAGKFDTSSVSNDFSFLHNCAWAIQNGPKLIVGIEGRNLHLLEITLYTVYF